MPVKNVGENKFSDSRKEVDRLSTAEEELIGDQLRSFAGFQWL